MHPNAMADCVFPEDIMLCILTRLPVKSIFRFRSVCKPWRELFLTRGFRKLHRTQFSSDPKNQSFIVHKINNYGHNAMSLFNIEPNEKEPKTISHLFSDTTSTIDIMCCNGVLCISDRSFLFLWNPVLFSHTKEVSLHRGFGETASLGFGYDAECDDFKVVRIIGAKRNLKNRESMKVKVKGVEVYSVNSGLWSSIDVGFHFSVFGTKPEVIVNGNPYWRAKVSGTKYTGAKNSFGEVLECFDVRDLVFGMVPLASLDNGVVKFVDWNGCLGALVWTMERVEPLDVWVFDDDVERVKSLDVWVFGDGVEQIWRRKHTFGPIEVNVSRFLQCSKDGKILGECVGGKLFVFDPNSGCVEEIGIGEARKGSFEIYRYTESLGCIKDRQIKKIIW